MSAIPKPPAVGQLDSQRCPKCNTPSKRNLVVCIDGTSNQFSIRNTNVVELYSRLTKNDYQRTFYNSGIGTYAKPHGLTLRQWIANKRDLAFAWQFDKVLLSAYRWLSENYETDDRIFLFGFSRGAYQVRALSAMIRDVGLIHKGNQDQIPFAYKLYADVNSREVLSAPLSTYESVKSYLYHVAGKKYPLKLKKGTTVVDLAARFKSTFSRQDVKVHFVGVWDTVSSVGFVYGKTLPGTTDGMEHTCFFRHALAIHERRVKFLPEFADNSNKTGGGSKSGKTTGSDHSDGGAGAQRDPVSDGLQASHKGPSINNNVRREMHTVQGSDELLHEGTLETDVPKKDATLDPQQPHIKEVWFAGSHSDIGGGNETNLDLDRFGPSLRWMSFESMLAGLKLDDDPRKWEGDPKNFKPYESLTWPWWVLELFFVKQLSFLNSSKRDATVRRQHLGRWRRAFAEEEEQKLHETALEVIGLDCLPPKARKYLLEKREEDPAGEAYSDHPYGPDLTKWPDLDIESDPYHPYHHALRFLRLLHADQLKRASDIERFEQLLAHASASPAGQKSIRKAIQELVDEDVGSNDANHNGKSEDNGKLRRKPRGKVLSNWGSILLGMLQEWDTKASADPACTRTLGAVFGLFKHLDARLSFPQSRELRRLAKSFARRGSEGSEDFLLLVNSVMPAAPDFPLRNRNDSAVFHPDGKRVILGSIYANDCLVLDYSSPTLSPPLHLAKGDRVYELAVSGDGAFIAIALAYPRETVLTIWDAASPGNEPINTVENAPAKLRYIAFNHDGTRLVAGCSNGAIIVWTKADGPVWSQLASFPDDRIMSISWSRDNYVAAGSDNGFLGVWNMGTATPTELLPQTKVGRCVDYLAFAPMTTPESSPIRIVTGGRRSFSESAHWQLGVVEDGVYRLLGHLKGDGTDYSPTCVSFSPGGKYIASGLSSGKVRIWDADSYKPVCDDIPGGSPAWALSFEPDDTAVKAVCSDGLVRLLCWK